MGNSVYIDGVNVAECEFLLSNYECMSNYEMIDCDGKITQFYKCKDCPNCYFKQLQRAKEDIEELKESNDSYDEAVRALLSDKDKNEMLANWCIDFMDRIEEIAHKKYPNTTYWCDTGSRWNVIMAMLQQFEDDLKVRK